ncbi:hypothetical protein CASFOL_029912 [Castilleja foliolosa]|uniref:CCHC-type domain-containing protein n=1 Tax=Castilleja foliolosa TaxID=1961234 RepID=A0ABD3C991_9LAMI
MRWFIKNIDERAWRAVITKWERPTKKDKDNELVPKREDEWDQNELNEANWNSKAMNTICSFIDIRYYKSIQRCESAKDAWDTLKKLCLGTAGVKKSRLRVLSSKFETIRMEENELINDYAMRLQEISGEMTELGENVTNERLVGKLLRSITRKFDTKITAIEEARDTSILPYDELVGSLNTYEMEHIKNREKNTAYTSNESFEYDSDDEEMSRAVLSLKNTPLSDDELSFITNRFRNYIKKKSNTGGNRFKSDISRPTGRSAAKPQNTDSTSNPSKPLSEVQCHECKGWGHYKNECANVLRKKNLIAQEFDENSEEEEDEDPQALVVHSVGNNDTSVGNIEDNTVCRSSQEEDKFNKYERMQIKYEAKFTNWEKSTFKIKEMNQEMEELEKKIDKQKSIITQLTGPRTKEDDEHLQTGMEQDNATYIKGKGEALTIHHSTGSKHEINFQSGKFSGSRIQQLKGARIGTDFNSGKTRNLKLHSPRSENSVDTSGSSELFQTSSDGEKKKAYVCSYCGYG